MVVLELFDSCILKILFMFYYCFVFMNYGMKLKEKVVKKFLWLLVDL